MTGANADSCCNRVHAALCCRRTLHAQTGIGVRAGQEQGFPDINIVMEKVAFDGITRFEDRERMPLGAPRLCRASCRAAARGPCAAVPSACTSAGRFTLSQCLMSGKAITWGQHGRFRSGREARALTSAAAG